MAAPPMSAVHVILAEVPSLHAIAPETVRPLKRAEYHRLAETGAFENERVELLYGTIVRMSPIGEPHNRALAKLNELLVLALHGRARVRPASSFDAGEFSEPEPDILVVPRVDQDDLPRSALLVVEISESSLATDRRVKKALYAEAGILEYWIVNLVDHVIEVYGAPVDGAYTRSTTYSPGESVRSTAFPDLSVAVSDVI
jgi:Uma2 family endonuclease